MCRTSLLLLVLAISFGPCWSKPGVQLVSALPSPQMVGTMIGLEARPIVDGDPEKQMRFLQYRFSVSMDGSPFRLLSDFNGGSAFIWRPDLYEHEARVKVTMRNTSKKESFDNELAFRILPRASAGKPVVSP